MAFLDRFLYYYYYYYYELLRIIIIIIITNPFNVINAYNLMCLWLPDAQEEQYLSSYQVVFREECLQSFHL